jgi:hypothetical protein
MTVLFEINGATYQLTGGDSVREVEERLRVALGGYEVSLNVLASNSGHRTLHVMPGSIGTYSVWESEEPTGYQN